MWVADIVRTHLWLVPSSRRKARARSSLSATGAEVPLMGRRGAGRANGCEGRPACVNNQEGRSGRRLRSRNLLITMKGALGRKRQCSNRAVASAVLAKWVKAATGVFRFREKRRMRSASVRRLEPHVWCPAGDIERQTPKEDGQGSSSLMVRGVSARGCINAVAATRTAFEQPKRAHRFHFRRSWRELTPRPSLWGRASANCAGLRANPTCS